MMQALNDREVSRIFGGWTCAASYEGRPFWKAVWHVCRRDKSKSFGSCHYDFGDKLVGLRAHERLVGIVNRPINLWSAAKDTETYSNYECLENNVSKCVFEEA